MTASDFFALVNTTLNKGSLECHYCASACENRWVHDDPPALPFHRNSSRAKRPNNAYVCAGCWLYRLQRVTVCFLGGGLRDRQTLSDFSWVIIPEGVWVVTPEGHEKLYQLLLKPPLRFCLSLISREPSNLIQNAVVNDEKEIRADTVLKFTLDGVEMSYTVYELEEGIRHGGDGKMPGVRALLDYLGPRESDEEDDDMPVARRPGRPFREDSTKTNTTGKKIR